MVKICLTKIMKWRSRYDLVFYLQKKKNRSTKTLYINFQLRLNNRNIAFKNLKSSCF